ncbi:MAG: glycosyltransferase family 39 protein [Ilumatobacteraceae bacterium]
MVGVSAIVALTLAVGARDLAPKVLWLDDAWVGLVHKAPLSSTISMSSTAPGFGLLLKLWLETVGFSETTALLPAFTAGLMAPAAVFWMFRERLGRVLALVAGLMISLSPTLGDYMDSVKQYTFEVLISAVIVWAALGVLDSPNHTRAFRRLNLIVIAGVIFSFTLVIVAIPALLAALFAVVGNTHPRAGWSLRSRTQLTPIIGWTSLSGLVSILVYLLTVRSRVTGALTSFWSDFYINATGTPSEILRSILGLLARFRDSLTVLPTSIVAVWVILGLILTLRAPLQAVVTLGPLALTMLLSAARLVPLGGGRTDLFLLAPTAIAGALGARYVVNLLDVALSDRRTVRRAVNGSLIAVVAVAIWTTAHTLAPVGYENEDIESMINILRAERRPDEPVVIYGWSQWQFALYTDYDFEIDSSDTPYGITFTDDLIIAQGLHSDDPPKFADYSAAADRLGGRMWVIGSHLSPLWDLSLDQISEDLGRREIRRWTAANAALVLFEARTP